MRPSVPPTVLAAALAAGSLLALACTSNDPPPEASPTPEATSTAAPIATGTPRVAPLLPTPTAMPKPTIVPFPSLSREAANARRSGVPEVDAVIDALLGGNQAALDPLVRLQDKGCTRAGGLGGPPACDADDVEGTVYPAFPSAQCEGFWLTRPPFLRPVDPASSALFAVIDIEFVAPSTVFDWPGADRIVIFERRGQRTGSADVAVGLDGAAIVWADYGCGDVTHRIDEAIGEPLIAPVSVTG